MNLSVQQRSEMINYMIRKNPDVTIKNYVEALRELEEPEEVTGAPVVLPKYLAPQIKSIEFRQVSRYFPKRDDPPKDPAPFKRPLPIYSNSSPMKIANHQ